MNAYKFETTVMEDGVIRIPEFKKYTNQKVEIFIVVKSENINNVENQTIDEFLDRWSGFFSTTDTDDVKYNYLMEKHK